MRIVDHIALVIGLLLVGTVFAQSPEKHPNIGSTLEVHHKHSGSNKRLGKRHSVSAEHHWNDVKNLSTEKALEGTHQLNGQHQVFGWHPHWMGTAYKSYNFGLLSMISYFSYEVNEANGKYDDIHFWKTTDLVSVAKKANPNIKVLLTASLFGGSKIHRFLDSPTSVQTFIDTITAVVKAKGGDGVTIDFEGLESADKELFTQFITTLKAKNPKMMVTITLPAIDWGKAFDIKALSNTCDYLIMMGYEYHYPGSRDAGPVSPLANSKEWGDYSLESSVNYYLSNGMPKEKFILAVSYFGAIWDTKSGEVASASKKFYQYFTYGKIQESFKGRPAKLDSASGSAYYAYKVKGGGYRQCWFDDSTSLSEKYRYIRKQQLGGVAIWALGFDNGYASLWNVLKHNFSTKAHSIPGHSPSLAGADSASADSLAGDSLAGKGDGQAAPGKGDLLSLIDNYLNTIMLAFAALIIAIIGGLIASSTHKEVRTKIQIYRSIVIGIPLCVLLLLNIILWGESAGHGGRIFILVLDILIFLSSAILYVWFTFRKQILP